jgi:hypothetical protein
VILDTFGRRPTRLHEYECPICGRKERNRRLLRQHILDAHPQSRGIIRSADRGGLALRAKRIKITLPGKKEEP